jgi:uncharacterized protein (TIGR03435 family)
MKRVFAFLLPFALGASVAAQQPAPAFDAASIKPDTSGGQRGTIAMLRGRYTASNVTLRELILNAYDLDDFQLSGGPAWIASDRFDIVATIPADATTVQPLLRTLLADRFKLTTHTEQRDGPAYALVVSRKDGALGPQIHPAKADCAPSDTSSTTVEEKAAKGKTKEAAGTATAPRRAGGDKPACAFVAAPGKISATGMTMAMLAGSLAESLKRPVADRTNADGAFELRLTWTPDQAPTATGKNAKPQKVDPNGPSLFSALQEQLGLKLDATRAPSPVLVIDRAEHPSAN